MKRMVNGELQCVRPDALTAEIFNLMMALKEAEERLYDGWEAALACALDKTEKAARCGFWRDDGTSLVKEVRVYSTDNPAMTITFNNSDRIAEAMRLPAYHKEQVARGAFRLEFHLSSQG